MAMKELTTVSIIIPIYNSSKYIGACIDSIFSQECEEADIECILVNDCTPDNSMEIVHNKLKDYRGRILFKTIHLDTNSGHCVARNAGIRISTGDYILFVDSDDILQPSTISYFIEGIKNNGGDITNLYVFLNSVNLLQLNGNAIEMGLPVGVARDTEYGVQIRDVVLPVGATVHLVLGAFIPDGTALIFDPKYLGPVEQPVPAKGNFFLEELAKTGAGAKYQIFGQIGLDHGPEWFSAKITGLSTTFTKPVGQKVVTVTEA